MTFDIRTAILGLAAGNLVFGLILQLFQNTTERPQRLPFLVEGKILQGFGWLLLYGRGVFPDILSFTVGNSALLIGTAYETWAMYRISQRAVSRALQVYSSAGIIALCVIATFLSAAGRIAVTSYMVMILFGLAGYAILGKPPRNSFLRRHIGGSMWFLVVVIGIRGTWAALAPENFTLFAGNIIQLITFATLFYLTLTNGFGMLLLSKEMADRELGASEARFRSYFELPLIGIAITSVDRSWLDVNAKLCDMLGYTRDELLSTTWAQLTHPDDLALDLAQFDRVKAGEIDGYDLEKRFVAKDGQIVFMHIAVHCMRRPDRSIEYFVELLQNITKRKRAEQALQESEEKYRFLTENMKDVNWTLDVETLRFLYVSPSVTQLRGYTPEEIMAEPMDAALTPEGAKHVRDLLKAHAGEFFTSEKSGIKQFFTEEVEQPCKDGTTVWTEVITVYLRNARTGAIEVHGVTRDITERKRAAQALQESEARYQDLYENAPDMYLSVEPSTGRILQCNQTVVRLTGFEKDALLGHPIYELYHPACLDAARQAMRTFLSTGEVHDAELQICRKDGSLIPVSLNVSAVRDAAGQIVQSRSSWRDITDRKQAEAALLAAHAELEQRVLDRTAELRTSNLSLEKALRARDEFMSAVSHELRTPLTGVLGLSEVLQMPSYGSLSEKQYKAVVNIEKSGQRLLRVINDMLDYSLLQSGSVTIHPRPCSIGNLCENALKSINKELVKKHQTIRLSINPDQLTLTTDERILSRVVSSLLNNATKFTGENGEIGIEVTGCQVHQKVAITIWDTGIGIQEQDFPRLFQPFVQLDASLSRRFEGTGLGLALVKLFSELLGGEVDVHSIPDQGSRFTITLPWN